MNEIQQLAQTLYLKTYFYEGTHINVHPLLEPVLSSVHEDFLTLEYFLLHIKHLMMVQFL